MEQMEIENSNNYEMNDYHNNDISEAVEKLVIINHIEKIKFGDLIIKKKVGEGGQAKVYMGTFENKPVAIKVLKNVDYKCFAHELVILAFLEHISIPKFYGIVKEESLISLVFEYIEGKTLDEYQPKDFDTNKKYHIIYELASCLEYIHSKKFIHRDLKPENLILGENGHIYLIDFSIAKVLTNSVFTSTRTKGTLNYLAPECLEAKKINKENQIISTITAKVDVWAFGCIVSWIFSGFVPWNDKYKDLPPIIQQVLLKKKDFSIPANITDQNIIKIIQMCTIIDVEKRATMSDVRVFMENNNMV